MSYLPSGGYNKKLEQIVEENLPKRPKRNIKKVKKYMEDKTWRTTTKSSRGGARSAT